MTMFDIEDPDAARCEVCGDSALKAMPLAEALTAAPYICYHCTENGWRWVRTAAVHLGPDAA